MNKPWRMWRILVGLTVFMLLLAPVAAQAADFFPIVPCGVNGDIYIKCTPCHIWEFSKNIIDLVLYGITGPLAAVAFIMAGAMVLLYPANPKLLNQAKALATNAAIGVVIVLLAWLIATSLIKTLASGNQADTWYDFSCPKFLSDANVPGEELPPQKEPVALAPLPNPNGDITSRQIAGTLPAASTGAGTSSSLTGADLEKAKMYAAKYKTAFPRKTSTADQRLIDCLLADPVVKAMTDERQLFTYDRDHEMCNYTRGQPSAGACSHGKSGNGSCHYGGQTGTDGSEAVDFNARMAVVALPDGTKVLANEEHLFCEIYRVVEVEKKCSDYKFLNWEKDHTHLSTTSCNLDAKGVFGPGGRNPAIIGSCAAKPASQ